MNTYEITLWGHTSTAIGETAGKAKYSFFREHEIDDSMDFGDFLKSISCRLVHRFHIKDLFPEDMEQFNRMKESRGIEFAHLGMKVEVDGKPGVIVGSNRSLNLDVCFEGQHWASNCHPWWRVKYLDNKGNVIREYGD